MLATTAPGPFDSAEHWFEIKWDGLRCIAFVERNRVRLQSRNLRDFTARYPALGELHSLFRGEQRAIIDGELLGFAGGRPSFQAALRGGGASLLMAFDLLHLDGRDLLSEPLEARHDLLSAAFDWTGGQLLLASPVRREGSRYFAAVAEQGLEGVIAKRLGSTYQPGVRSRDWLKVVARRTMTCTLLGVTAGAVPVELFERPFRFGALLVGTQGGQGWIYLGNVGTGWDARRLAALLSPLAPAAEPPWPRASWGRISGAPPGPIARATAWVAPTTDIVVAYREITADGVLRHPSFLRIAPAPEDGGEQLTRHPPAETQP